MRLSGILVLIALTTMACSQPAAEEPQGPANDYWVYFGTGADGIYVSEYDSATGSIYEPKLADAIERPNFLAVGPNGDRLYAVAKIDDEAGVKYDVAASYRLDPKTGALEMLTTMDVGTVGPCHINVHESAKMLAVANYAGGAVTSMTLGDQGQILQRKSVIEHNGSGPVEGRQDAAHAHSVNFTPDGRFVVVADLGVDKLFVYAVDTETGELTPNDPPHVDLPPGSGPRHFSFHPNGRFGYAINELASTVSALSYDAEKGAFTVLQTITTLPENYDGPENSTAEVLIHPSGKFLYGSNRGDNSIAVFSIDESTGELTPVERVPSGGDWPRNFRLDPAGNYLYTANQKSNDIVQFRIDPATGKLTPTGVKLTVESPMCIRFVKLG